MNLLLKIFAAGLIGKFCLISFVSGYSTRNGTHICCNGTIGDISMACCGSQPYNTSKSVCCNDQLSQMGDGQHYFDYDCCGAEAHIRGSAVCCNSQLFQMGDGDYYWDYDCCGSEAHIRGSALCCNSQLFRLDDGQNFEDYKCCNSATGKSTIYNIHTSLCCGEVITNGLPGIDTAKNYGCCDDTKTNQSLPFVRGISLCCNGRILEKENTNAEYECCGGQLIKKPRLTNCGKEEYYLEDVTETCCGDTYIYNPNKHSCVSSYNYENRDRQYELFDRFNEYLGTCGMKVYDRRTQGCCYQEIYNTTSSSCCGLKVVPFFGRFSSCCYEDRKVFDVRTQFCSEEGIANLSQAAIRKYQKYFDLCGPSFPLNFLDFPLNEEEDDKNVYVALNETHICCNGEVGVNTMRCCGNTIHDPETTLCCSGVIINVSVGEVEVDTMRCCGNTIHDSETSVCCSGVIFNVSVGEVPSSPGCCQSEVSGETNIFSYDNALCCNGVVRKLGISSYDRKYACCGTDLIDLYPADGIPMTCCGDQTKYDLRKHACVEAYDGTSKKYFKLVNVSNDHTAACAFELYDTWTDDCCDGTTIFKKESQICCSGKLYTKTFLSSCCETQVYDYSTHYCNGSKVANLPPILVEEYGTYLAMCGPGFPLNVAVGRSPTQL